MFYNSSYGDILVVVHSSKRKNVKISLKHNLENGEIEIHLHGPRLKESGAGIYLDRFKDWLDKKIFYSQCLC